MPHVDNAVEVKSAVAAEAADIPIFGCPLITMKFINLATLALEMMFAPRGSEMGSMVDITSQKVTALIEPIIIVLMAAIVGFIVLAVILPLVQGFKF